MTLVLLLACMHAPPVASVLYRQGQLPKAKAAYERALAVKITVHGEQSASTADTMYNLAMLLRDQNALTEATILARRCVAASEASLGEANPRTADARTLLEALAREGREAGVRI